MKDIIYSYYDLDINKIYRKDDKLFFFANNYKILIYICKREEIQNINKLIELTNNLFKIINVNTFVINKNGSYFTEYNNNYLFLVRINNMENDFCKNDIIKFWNLKTNLDDYNILEEWKNEVDNIENKIIEYNKEYKIVQNSINYYIGIAENAIELLNDYENIIKEHNDSIGHRVSYKLFDNNSLLDPFTFIRINRMYDVSNYIKYMFLKNKLDYNEVESFFLNANEYEKIFLFCNLLYPSVYFNLLNGILNDSENELKIEELITKRKKYIKLLSFCKKIVKTNKNAQLINWFD